jgi:hypothetical protein
MVKPSNFSQPRTALRPAKSPTGLAKVPFLNSQDKALVVPPNEVGLANVVDSENVVSMKALQVWSVEAAVAEALHLKETANLGTSATGSAKDLCPLLLAQLLQAAMAAVCEAAMAPTSEEIRQLGVKDKRVATILRTALGPRDESFKSDRKLSEPRLQLKWITNGAQG